MTGDAAGGCKSRRVHMSDEVIGQHFVEFVELVKRVRVCQWDTVEAHKCLCVDHNRIIIQRNLSFSKGFR